MKALLLALPVVMVPFLSVQAADKVIAMKLVTKVLNKEATGGQRIYGNTFQRDGTIGTKDFFVTDGEKKGEYVGLSTYKFEDGSITASFAGGAEAGRHKGTYQIMFGTGRYAGAKGDGAFEGVGPDQSPLPGAGIFDVTLNVTLPPSN